MSDQEVLMKIRADIRSLERRMERCENKVDIAIKRGGKFEQELYRQRNNMRSEMSDFSEKIGEMKGSATRAFKSRKMMFTAGSFIVALLTFVTKITGVW